MLRSCNAVSQFQIRWKPAGTHSRRGGSEILNPIDPLPTLADSLCAPIVFGRVLNGAEIRRDCKRTAHEVNLHPANPDRTQVNPDGTTLARKAEQHRRPAWKLYDDKTQYAQATLIATMSGVI